MLARSVIGPIHRCENNCEPRNWYNNVAQYSEVNK